MKSVTDMRTFYFIITVLSPNDFVVEDQLSLSVDQDLTPAGGRTPLIGFLVWSGGACRGGGQPCELLNSSFISDIRRMCPRHPKWLERIKRTRSKVPGDSEAYSCGVLSATITII